MDKQTVVRHIARLLQEMPTSSEIVKNDHKREQRFEYLANHMAEKGLEKNALIVSEDQKGIAILFRTSSQDKNFWKDLITDIKLALNVTGIRKGLKALKVQKYVKNQRPAKGEYLYCWFWGILPDARGTGEIQTAYQMKNQFFEMSKELQLPIYAETRIRRISLAYQRYGFKLFNEWDHPSGDKMYFLKYTPPPRD